MEARILKPNRIKLNKGVVKKMSDIEFLDSEDEEMDFDFNPIVHEEEEEPDDLPLGLAALVGGREMRPGIKDLERVTVVADTWIVKMQSCCNEGSRFSGYKVPQGQLNALRRSATLSKPVPPSFTSLRIEDKSEALNPIAVALAYHLHLRKGKERIRYLKELDKLLSSGKACSSSSDCKEVGFDRCSRNECRVTNVDLASLLRYEKLWNRCLK